MLRTMFKSKIHRATVTQADLHYVGSVTVDAELMEAADLLPGELVHIVDIDNGARLETYVIEGSAARASSASTAPPPTSSTPVTWSSSSAMPRSRTPRRVRSGRASCMSMPTTGSSPSAPTRQRPSRVRIRSAVRWRPARRPR